MRHAVGPGRPLPAGVDPEQVITVTARQRAQVALAYLAFVLVGVNAGVGGVLLPAQIADYRVSRATIGLTFLTFSVGFVIAGVVAGPLIHRLGLRWTLVVGTTAAVVAGLYLATRPPFIALVLVQVLAGTGAGVAESALNAHLAGLPSAAVLLGRLHAFFGVGALIGPLLATWMLRRTPWTAVVLVTALAYLPVLLGFVLVHRDERALHGHVVPTRPDGPDTGGPPGEPASGELPGAPGGLLTAVLRQRAVVLAAVFLSVYVGLEISVGNWGFSYLVGERHRSDLAAGNAVSGFWLGLTLGRFVISPLGERLGWTTPRVTTACLALVAVTGTVIWVVPSAAVAVAGLGVLGFFLGPLFPTTMAVMPMLTRPQYVATAIGVLNGVSAVGGSALPWLGGTLTEAFGLWVLMPFVVLLAFVQLLIWRRLVAHPGEAG